MARKKKDSRTEFEKKAEIRYIEMSDCTKIRVLDFKLAKNPDEYILMFIPGFVTVFQSWEKVLKPLSEDFRILYFESREKASSIMPNRREERKITLQKMAYDIKETVEKLDLNSKKYVTVCSSTGGTIQVEALSKNWLYPQGCVMVGPMIEFNMKFIAGFMMTIVPEFVKKLFHPVLRWYMGTVFVKKKEHPEQYAKYVRAGEEASLRKTQRVTRQTRKYQCWDMVPKIEHNCLLIGASTDKMHASEATKKVHSLLPNSSYIDLGSNEATHSEPLVKTIREYVVELKKNS